MAYAKISDMVNRFGQAEMIRASVPDGAEAVAIVPATIETALHSASALIDSYLRKRYQTPLPVAPDEIVDACCILARYTLSTGGAKLPSDQIKDDRAEKITWLRQISEGKVVLDVAEVAPGGQSFAQAQTRPAVFGSGPGDGGYCGDGIGFFNGGWP
jgi:phage gp36-like protein